ncbi:hypothetical protein DRE_00074 [Drechslerella stenobrocha 248]|uniref:tripeptidyl-peptidase II n=1 Tax=Drechslerella stenobrocha 248 TaxID=1043628 RepID=W7HZ29_9PEZI|nr:hypothetical protein DRE_00074 [Drechslerella stenobrocha 248]
MHLRWPIHVLAVCLSGLAAALPAYSSADYVVHESRTSLPQGWQRDSRLAADAKVPVKIGLAQANLHRGEELLLQISHPDSPMYGKHWTPEQVRQQFAPSKESYAAVSAWLTAAGVANHKFDARGWISFTATVGTVEAMLRTEYYLYEHTSGQMHIGCEAYSLPREIHTHVDIVLPTLHWDVYTEDPSSEKQQHLRRLSKRSKMARKRSVGAIVDSLGTGFRTSGARRLTTSDASHLAKLSDPKYATVARCDEAITPDCLRQLYKFGVNHNPMKNNSIAVVSFSPQTYLQADMDNFFGNFSPALKGTSPELKSINGGYVLPFTGDWWNAVETNMDLQYLMTIVHPQKTSLFQVGDGLQDDTRGEYNSFLNAIDGDYCTFDGGNDVDHDAVYPNPAEGGYKGQPMCGTYEPALVFSISYGGNEADYTQKYATRQCNEYLKLGLMGVSVLFASGDFGVGGYGSQCRDASGNLNDGLSGRFTPDYPATCPYVTAVGGTYIPTGKTVFDPEHAWNTFLPWAGINASTGGGFSEYFATPSYQTAALASYLAANPNTYTSAQYNNSGLTRAYPDVAANAWNYVVGIENVLDLIGGTSAATPTFAGIVGLLNQDRLYRKKSPLGFLNPALYANPDMLNDITVGNNPGCGTSGFQAVKGWDPVTGLGTANFQRMRSYFGALP